MEGGAVVEETSSPFFPLLHFQFFFQRENVFAFLSLFFTRDERRRPFVVGAVDIEGRLAGGDKKEQQESRCRREAKVCFFESLSSICRRTLALSSPSFAALPAPSLSRTTIEHKTTSLKYALI